MYLKLSNDKQYLVNHANENFRKETNEIVFYISISTADSISELVSNLDNYLDGAQLINSSDSSVSYTITDFEITAIDHQISENTNYFNVNLTKAL